MCLRNPEGFSCDLTHFPHDRMPSVLNLDVLSEAVTILARDRNSIFRRYFSLEILTQELRALTVG